MSDQEWYEILENLILDENRTISYKLLSKELNIDINKAKKYLSEFLNIQASKNVQLKSTYFLSGTTDIDGIKSCKVYIVSDDSLEKTKQSLSNVTSCHIYSVGTGLVDECSLYGAEKTCNSNYLEFSKFFPIKHPKLEIKAPVLSKNLKNEVKSSSNSISSSVKTSTKESSNAQTVSNDNCNHQQSETVTKTTVSKTTSESKKSKSNVLTSLWQKNEDKQKEKSEKSVFTEKEKNKSPQKSKQAASKNNIMSMFSRQAEKASACEKKTSPLPPAKEEVLSSETVKNITTKKKDSKTVSSKPAQKNNSNKRKSTKKSNEESDEDTKPDKKKRRRICTFEESDSESESEEAVDRAQRCIAEEGMEEAPIPATPGSDDSEEPIPPTPPVANSKGKRKIWKNVQKTYKDEDGFFVTKQEKVMVSESDSGGEDPIPQKSSTKETKKANPFVNKKQSSLTQFFKQA